MDTQKRRTTVAEILMPFDMTAIQDGSKLLRPDWRLSELDAERLNRLTCLEAGEAIIQDYAGHIDICLTLPLPGGAEWTLRTSGETAHVGIQLLPGEPGIPSLPVHIRNIAPGLLWCWWWEPVRHASPSMMFIP